MFVCNNCHSFSYSCMAICVERNGVRHEYTLLEKLGNGSYSQVYKCKRVVEGKEELFVFCIFSYFM